MAVRGSCYNSLYLLNVNLGAACVIFVQENNRKFRVIDL